MPKGIYVSDADVEMSKDIESLRIDRHLTSDLSSRLPGRRRKMIDRIEEYGGKNPLAVVPLLVKHYDDDDPKVRKQIRASLARLTQSELGELALVECMFSRHPFIASTAAAILEERNFNSVNLLSYYRQTENLIMQARKTDVFCQDVEELVTDSIDTYKEGRFDQAMTNMMMAKDLLEDRLEWHGHLTGYIRDVLRLTPVLGRSGVQIDAIQDSIRNVSSAMQTREYNDARSLLDLRRHETRLWKQLWSLEEYVTKRIKVKPLTELMVLRETDKHLLDSFIRLHLSVEGLIQGGKAVDALKIVEEFIRDEVSAEYLAKEGKRLDSKDEAAWYTMWSVGLGLLKLVSPVVPNLAEEFYQQYFRDREGSPSIHTVPWPEPFAQAEAPSGPPAKPKKGKPAQK
ncbi:MAG: class I tRNA ligase family protein [Thermoplasmatota archaeon]|nr:class I tRNA ligase family protein [Candidatus Thermoplasmatota archaeon]MBU1914775.1 class I tRNA ligase family protein [Candidatus Thermoplasmatota archaeon]